MRYPILAMAAILGGCASVPTQMDKGLSSLQGMPIAAATDRLGYPDSQRDVMGDQVYVWQYNGISPGFGGVPLQANCTIQIGTGDDGRIKSSQWGGNIVGCEQYARALSH